MPAPADAGAVSHPGPPTGEAKTLVTPTPRRAPVSKWRTPGHPLAAPPIMPEPPITLEPRRTPAVSGRDAGHRRVRRHGRHAVTPAGLHHGGDRPKPAAVAVGRAHGAVVPTRAIAGRSETGAASAHARGRVAAAGA